jgi:fibronectin type 3 domain-containing protein
MRFTNPLLVALFTAFVLVTSFNPNSSEWLRVEASEYSNTALLSWMPPTENEDGSALTDLAGYNIYMGTVSKEYTEVIPVGIGLTSYMIENLEYDTTYYFAMTALNEAGLESEKSNEVFKHIKSGTIIVDPQPEPVVPARPKAPAVSGVVN